MANLTHAFKHNIAKTQFALQQLSWQGQAGLALLVLALVIALVWLIPALKNQQQLSVQLLQPMAQVPLTQAPLEKQQTANNSVTQKFYAILPAKQQTDALSANILALADNLGLVFERAEFSSKSSENSAIIHHQIKLPMKGTYLQIRQFLNTLLNEQPTLALTEIELHRDDVFSDMIEANLVLTLYLRGDAK